MLLNLANNTPQANIIFEDSIYRVTEDHEFICMVDANYNSVIKFPSYAERIRLGGSPFSYNQEMEIPNASKDISFLFINCWNYDKPINIPNNVSNMALTLHNCRAFNQSVNIPDSVTNLYASFEWCSNLNKPVRISNNAAVCSNMFQYASKFNQYVDIPNGVESCSYMFNECGQYDQPTFIPESVNSCVGMFGHCYQFNSVVTFAENSNVTDMRNMFDGCHYFNQPVTIPNGVTSLYFAFRFTYNFNQNVNIPNGASNCYGMFMSSCLYNGSVVIPGTVVNSGGMFSNVSSRPVADNGRTLEFTNEALKNPIYFNMYSIANSRNMFNNCNSMSQVYICGLQNNMQARLMFRDNGSASRLNIYTDESCKTLLSQTNNMMCSGATPVWQSDETNGCIYNTTYNIYIYNNWDGVIPAV